MTEIEGTNEIFAEFNERHIEILAKIHMLRIELLETLPEIAPEDPETSQNPLKSLIWIWDEQEKEIENLRQEIEQISNLSTPEKSDSVESGIIEEIFDFEEPWITDKTWNEVSANLKSLLGQTSPDERCRIDEMLLFGNRNFLSIWRNGQCDLKISNVRESGSDKKSKALLRILQYIFEICDFQNLVVYDLPDAYAPVFQGAKFPPIRVKNFFSKSLSDLAMAILKMCDKHIQLVEFDAFDTADSKLQKITSVRAPRMYFLNMNGNPVGCTVLIKNWIYNSPELGAELSIQQVGEFDVENFLGRFRKFIVRRHGKWEQEMRTSEPMKNVLIQLIPSQSIIKCTVVHPGAIGVVYA